MPEQEPQFAYTTSEAVNKLIDSHTYIPDYKGAKAHILALRVNGLTDSELLDQFGRTAPLAQLAGLVEREDPFLDQWSEGQLRFNLFSAAERDLSIIHQTSAQESFGLIAADSDRRRFHFDREASLRRFQSELKQQIKPTNFSMRK